MRHFLCKRRTTYLLLGALLFLVTFIDLQLMYHNDTTLYETRNYHRVFANFESAEKHHDSTPAITIKLRKFQNISVINVHNNLELRSSTKISAQFHSQRTHNSKLRFFYLNNRSSDLLDRLSQNVLKLKSELPLLSNSESQFQDSVGKRPQLNFIQLKQSKTVSQINIHEHDSNTTRQGNDISVSNTTKNAVLMLSVKNALTGTYRPNTTIKTVSTQLFETASIKTVSSQTLKNELRINVFNATIKMVSTQSNNDVLSDVRGQHDVGLLSDVRGQPDLHMSSVSNKTVSIQTNKRLLPKMEDFLQKAVDSNVINTSVIHTNQSKRDRAFPISLVNPGTNVPQNEHNMSSETVSKDGDFGTYQNKTPHLMKVGSDGRLGNNIFQLAALIGISGYHGYTPQVSGSHRLRRVFKINLPQTHTFQNEHRFNEKYAGIFDPEVLSLKHDVNWTMIGFYQSWRYFLNSTLKIREQLRFNNRIMKDVRKSLPEFVKNVTTVGVHVRRGDMNTNYERKRGYSIASEGYIKRAMKYYRNKYLNPLFIICSDDMIWCQKYLNSSDTVFIHVSAEVDMAVLAHCTHSIITSGTYGWWGAFLAGGETVYYKNYPHRKSWLESQYKRADYYLPYWVGMD